MTLVFASLDDSANPNSGQNAFYMRRALEGVSPLAVADRLRLTGVRRGMAGALELTTRRRSPVFATEMALDSYSRRIRSKTSAVVATGVIVNQPLLAHHCKVPFVVHTDSTTDALVRLGGYYDDWSRRALDHMIRAETDVFDSATSIVVTSQWAADSLTNQYGVTAGRVLMLPIGANLPPGRGRAEADVPPPDDLPAPKTVRCIFYSGDWARKGGAIAVEALSLLEASGWSVHLDVAGPSTRPPDLPSWADWHGRLDKSDASDLAVLERLFLDADLHLLPTRSDCSPVSVPEAAAFGVPTITADVGGTSDQLADGKSGRLLSTTSSPQDWASCIAELMSDRGLLAEMKTRAYQDYASFRNWDVIAQHMKELLP